MKVRILFFGATAETVGAREIQMEITDDYSAASVFERVVAGYPTLSKHDLRFAVNQSYSTGDESLSDGDEIAIFTQVSGG